MRFFLAANCLSRADSGTAGARWLRCLALTLCLALSLSLPAMADGGSGVFSGRSGHVASGGGSLVQAADGSWEVHLASDFKLDRAPGPWVSLGRGGDYVPGTLIKELRSRRGMQVYKVPARINAAEFDTIVIWCKPFNVPLAVARLQ